MGSEEICLNQEVKMQATAFKDKKQRAPDHKEGSVPQGADPDYENITLTFRNQEQPRGSHSPPKNRGKQPPASPHLTASGGAPVPAWSRPAPDSAQVPRWLHRATLSLYTLLALFCIVLLALVLVKNSEVSQELLVVKRELQNVSISGQQCQEEQKQGWSSIQQLITEARQDIDMIKRNVHMGNEKVKMLSTDLSQIKTKLHEISKILEKKPQPQPTAQ
ncbi:mast cell-expressed membrane protein 1 isoform X1 [Acinonyx jubatus]|uniref:Mast cell-expressed membrane protein 1 isoform X1 n=1 Tax=Acinonyx jubatus TaxID=32536 RepID=A0A6I9ZNR0_ACIJB|nr:mast cell-expressed membrane protein 1 isoform X1 [Acinonyx jubatus]